MVFCCLYLLGSVVWRNIGCILTRSVLFKHSLPAQQLGLLAMVRKDTKVTDIPEETKDAAEEAPTEAKAKRKT